MNLEDYRSGSTEPWTVDLLCAIIRAKKPHIVIETGTFEGRTACALAEAMATYSREHSSILYTVECDPVRHKMASERLYAFLPTINGSVGLQMIFGDAVGFLMREELRGAVDFVFLDDDHTAAHVHDELRWVAEVLRPGGICCVHDVVGPFGLGEAVMSYGGLVLDLPRFHAAGGLGIVVKSS